ncbi:TPA: hypothetical protein DD617_00510 [Candidatus Uhrbacteria bacterium]|nr:hypothetical protein [Candidatus Uhrbacteria bacterium]
MLRSMSFSLFSSRIRLPRTVTFLIVLVCILTSFVFGLFLGRQQGVRLAVPSGEGRVLGQGGKTMTALEKDVDFQLFWNVWNLVKETYYQQPVSDKSLFYGAVMGMVAGLQDPYSVFFDPTAAEEFNKDLTGSFEGVGAEIGIKNHQLQIVAPLPGSPAEAAGIKSGDKIFLIDGKETANMTVEEAISLIRGERGTTVVLTISRDGLKDVMEVSVVRDTIKVNSVRAEMREDGIAVIHMYLFNEDTEPLFTAAVNESLSHGARGIILDLRSNPGGLLTAAIDVASAWIGKDPVVIQRVRDRQDVFPGSVSARLQGIPTVVLVNGGSASGSEIVAGALQDYGYATLIGEQTFGKGSVQDYRELDDGSAVKITIAEWLTPYGRSINHVGIAPDVQVPFTEEDFKNGRDPQFDTAIEWLQKAIK